MVRTFKRKLHPTKAQAQRIASWIGACRVVYNLALEVRIAAWKNQQKSTSPFELMKQLLDLKQDYPWIKDVPSQSLQAVIERLEKSYQRFFKGAGFPKWAKKKSFRSIHLKSIKVLEDKIVLPKMGEVRIFKDAPIVGTPKTAQIILEPTGLFICIQCELPDQKSSSESQATGLDLGIAHFCVLSDGTMIENPRHFARHERRLRRASRSLARKKKGSAKWKKQVRQLARLHYTIGNARRDFLHKISTQIAKKYSLVYVEDLNIQGMVSNRHLSKHILDSGWGMFRTMMEYKTKVVKVDPKYTSQTCSICGTVDKKNRRSQSEFVCVSCGHLLHADINAAKNIMSRGQALVRKRSAGAQA